MPDARLRRARATLPEGYQFGDARPEFSDAIRIGDTFQFSLRSPSRVAFIRDGEVMVEAADGWRAPHENAAAQLKRNQQRTGEDVV